MGQADHTAFLATLDPVTRAALTERRDGPGLRHLAAHGGLIVVCGALIAARVPGWWLLLPAQGILVAFLFTLAHECTHQTPFRSRRLNEVVGHVASALLLMPFRWFRYYHLAHHRHTSDPARDPELAGGGHPRSRARWLLHVSGLPFWWAQARVLIRLALGREDAPYLPESARPAMIREARLLLAVYAGVAVFSALVSPMLLWVWIVPALIGQPVLRLYLLAEHGDCPQVADMFLNTRTTFTTRAVRFLAWNMPYHAEHHVLPTVPFHSLPALHRLIRNRLGVTESGYIRFTRRYLARLDG